MRNDKEIPVTDQDLLEKMNLPELFAYQQRKHKEWMLEIECIRRDTLSSFLALAGIYE